jgi:hypothetical protein
MLTVNPKKRITIDEIMEDNWFKVYFIILYLEDMKKKKLTNQ